MSDLFIGAASPPRITLGDAEIPAQRSSEMQGLENTTPVRRVGSSRPDSSHPADATSPEPVITSPAEPTPPDAFPQFADGDVLIMSGAGQSWKLHSDKLRPHSDILAALLHPDKATHITRKQRDAGMTIRWKIEMAPNEKNPTDNRLRSFRLVNSAKLNFRLNDDVAQQNDRYHKVYDNLFKCMYGIDPELTKEFQKNAGINYIADTVAILLAAEHINALHSLRLTLESHFLRLGQLLWKHIAAKPERWSFMAARIKSELLFEEAMIHVAGKLDMKRDIEPAWFMSHPLRRKIFALAEKKAQEIKEKKLDVERRLLEFYPHRMMHPQVENQIPSRAIYSSDIYLWQARNLVQQYMASCFFSNLHHRGHDGGVQFYRTIGTGGEAYLSKNSHDQFYKCFSMSGKGKNCFADAVDVIKDELKPIVRDLLHDRSQAKSVEGDDKIPWLTCAKIFQEEYPWEKV